MTTISLWDPDRIWVSCKNCGRWNETPISSGGRAGVCSNCRRSIEIPPIGQAPPPYSVADQAAIARNRTDSLGWFLFLCPNCGRKFSLPNRAEGDLIKCFQCGLVMVVQRVISLPELTIDEHRPPTDESVSSPTSEHRSVVVLDRSKQEELKMKGSGQEKCSYCAGPFDVTESDYFCPECGLRFHEQCWNENQGCAAPGCKMQPVLKSSATIRIPPLPQPRPGIPRGEVPDTPWAYLMLPGTIIFGIIFLFIKLSE
jgi:hypothetical protein